MEKEVKVFLIALSLENLSILNFEYKMNNPSSMVSIQTCIAEQTARDSLFIKMLNILMWSALAKRLYAVCHKYHLGVFWLGCLETDSKWKLLHRSFIEVDYQKIHLLRSGKSRFGQMGNLTHNVHAIAISLHQSSGEQWSWKELSWLS